MMNRTHHTKPLVSLVLALSLGAPALACSSHSSQTDLEQTVSRYESRLEQANRVSERHAAKVREADTTEEVAEAERDYSDEMGSLLDDMGGMIVAMGSCGHHAEHAENTLALREDVEAMQQMHERHQAHMAEVQDIDAMREGEATYQKNWRTRSSDWAEHQETMATHAEDCPCGDTGDGMMGDGMMGGGMM